MCAGGILFLCILFMYSSVLPNVKMGQFEIVCVSSSVTCY